MIPPSALFLALSPLQGTTLPDVEPLVVSENLFSPSALSGTVLSAAGDWNGDGVPDYAIGFPDYDAPGSPGGPLTDAGLVQICSGVDGEQLDAWVDLTHVNLLGDSLEPRLGAAVAGPFDTNQNGRDELAVGLPGVDLVQFIERDASGFIVKVGQIAKPIDFTGQFVWDEFGAVLEHLGDVNGDGWDDLGIGAPQSRAFVGPIEIPNVGAVNLRSSATLLSIAQIQGTAAEGRFGAAICGISDQSGDSVRDVAVGEPGSNRVRLYAPGDPGWGPTSVLAQIDAPVPGGFEFVNGFGSELADLGNQDGLGPGDLLVEADQSQFFASSSVYVASFDLAQTGGSVHWAKSILGSGACHHIAAADLDGDGRREVLQTIATSGSDGDAGLFEPVDYVEVRDALSGLLVRVLPAPGLGVGGPDCGDIARVGDIDADGGEEVAVGLPYADHRGGTIVYGLAVDGIVAAPGDYTVDDFGPVDFTSLALATLVAPQGSVIRAERASPGSWGDVYLGRGLTLLGSTQAIGRLEVDRLTLDRASGASIAALTADSVRVLRTSGRVTFSDLDCAEGASWIESSEDVSFLQSHFELSVDPQFEGTPPAVVNLRAASAQFVGCAVIGADGPGLSSAGGVGARADGESRAHFFGTDLHGGDGAPGAPKFSVPGGSGGSALVLEGASTAIVRGNSTTSVRGGQGASFGVGVVDGFDIEGDAPSGNIAFVDPALPLSHAVGVQFQNGPTPYLLHSGSAPIGSAYEALVHAGAGLPVIVSVASASAVLDFSLLIAWVPLWVDPNAILSSTTAVGAGLESPVGVSFAIPNNANLIGLTLHLQAFAPQVSGNIFDGTNGNGFVIRDGA